MDRRWAVGDWLGDEKRYHGIHGDEHGGHGYLGWRLFSVNSVLELFAQNFQNFVCAAFAADAAA